MATGNSFDGQKSVRGSEEDFHIVCLPCHRDGETMSAFGYCCQCKEHLCAGCFRYHKKARPFKHHRLLDKDEMPDTQDFDATVQSSPSDNLTTPCPNHKNEMLKFYCHDHRMLLCGICVALEHTKQCQVAYIPDISEQIINSKEYENVKERMKNVLTECASIKDKTSEDAEKSNSSMNKGLEDMKMLRKKMNDTFDKMEEDIENKIVAVKQQNEDRLEEDESICNDVIKKVTVVFDSLNQLNASKQADLLFVELKQALNQIQEYENSISLLSIKNPIETYKFVPSSIISDMLHSEESWGDLTAIQQQHASTSDQQEDQTKYQTELTNIQGQVVNTSAQRKQQASTTNQQQDQTGDQTKPTNCQDQTSSTLTQQQQRASTTDQHPEQARDQSKPTNCQDQVVSSSTQQQQQPQRTSTSDQQQGQVIDETKPKGNKTRTTISFDEQQQSKIEFFQAQAASTSSQQQGKTKDQAKRNNNKTIAASFSDQQQLDKTEAQTTTPTSQQTKPTNNQSQSASTSSQLQNKTKDQEKPHNNGTQSTSLSEQQQQGKIIAQPTPTSQQAQPTNYQALVAISSDQQQDQTSSTNGIYSPASRPSYENIQAISHGEMNVKKSEDMENCKITGMTTLPSGKLVLVDNRNCVIKLVDINTDQIISILSYHRPMFSMRLNLLGSPWTITATSSTQVAVTVPNKQEIQIITATDKLSLSHKIKTNNKCFGICYRENKLVVTYRFPGKLEIMNLRGKVMTSVQGYSTGEDIFKYPDYVQANSNYIYVSDSGKQQVIMLNWQGEVTGRIGGLDGPVGLTLLHDGSLLVCGWGGNKVYHVSGDCTNKRAVLAGVSYPRAICVNDGGHTLYISRANVLLSTGDNNSILVYKL